MVSPSLGHREPNKSSRLPPLAWWLKHRHQVKGHWFKSGQYNLVLKLPIYRDNFSILFQRCQRLQSHFKSLKYLLVCINQKVQKLMESQFNTFVLMIKREFVKLK